MTPARYLACLSALRWTGAEVARWCGYVRESDRQWRTGETAVPPQVAAWLERRMAGRFDDPPRKPPQKRAGRRGPSSGRVVAPPTP